MNLTSNNAKRKDVVKIVMHCGTKSVLRFYKQAKV